MNGKKAKLLRRVLVEPTKKDKRAYNSLPSKVREEFSVLFKGMKVIGDT